MPIPTTPAASEKLPEINLQSPFRIAEIDGKDWQSLACPEGLYISQKPVTIEKFEFFDTFEWGIWHSDKVLYRVKKRLVLRERVGDWLGNEEIEVRGMDAQQVFLQAMGESSLKLTLLPVVGFRKLLPVFTLTIACRRFEVKNQMEKTVFRFDILELFTSKEKSVLPVALLIPRPLLGYNDAQNAVMLGLRTLAKGGNTAHILDVFLKKTGIVPSTYTLKATYPLTSAMRASEAVRQIASMVLACARVNEAGVIEDIDTEFLHDYRICIRKTRALLGLTKGIFDISETATLMQSLGHFARSTNRLRDLDVQELTRKEFLHSVPEDLRSGLKEMFTDFQKERKIEQKKVASLLISSDYRSDMAAVQSCFMEKGFSGVANVEAPIASLAAERIWKRFRRLIRFASRLQEASIDSEFHALRIEAKKLRYLLEFFRNLFPEDSLRDFEKQFRRLQNLLGVFNDLSVHQHFLMDYWKKKQKRVGKHYDLAFSLGGVLMIMNHRKPAMRQEILETIESVCGENNVEKFRNIFAQTDSQKKP